MAMLRNLLNSDFLFKKRRTMHHEGSPILKTTGLGMSFNGDSALIDVNFELNKGEQIAVVGPNGAGKSTLFKIVAGVLKPTAGEVYIAGHEPGGHICIAYIPQRSQVDWNFPVSVSDVVMMGRIGKIGLFRHPSRNDWQFVMDSLEVVGLSDLAGRQIGELSGGQQQRMFIARALAQEAELMLMDEPLTGLDVPSLEDIFQILISLQRQQVTVMIAMHDLKIAADHFKKVMLLNRKVIKIGPPDQVFDAQTLKLAYGDHVHLVPTEEGMLAMDDACCDDEDERP